MKNTFFVAVCVTITIALVFAWTQRWSYGPKQTSKDNDTNIILSHKKDHWAKQDWLVINGVDGSKTYYGTENPVPNEDEKSKANTIRDLFTYAWAGLTLLFLLLSIVGLLNIFRNSPLQASNIQKDLKVRL
ncbi:hypothetical protein ACWM35_01515 [Neobacillus sp. K501]